MYEIKIYRKAERMIGLSWHPADMLSGKEIDILSPDKPQSGVVIPLVSGIIDKHAYRFYDVVVEEIE